MSTLAVMKERIADELARSDLTAMIGYAISDAIAHYQSRRFLFNESRDIQFNTVVDQEWYDRYDHAAIPNLMEIDYIRVAMDDFVVTLHRDSPDEIEVPTTSPATGYPSSYTYYNQQLRFYPIPDNADWEVTIAAHVKVDEPADDDEIRNPWMTDAERLVRARAKVNLARNVNASGLDPSFSPSALVIFKDDETDAFNELKSRTAKAVGTGKVRPYA